MNCLSTSATAGRGPGTAAVLAEALRVARESARDVEAEHLLDKVTILLEPGRSVIADTGVLLTKVRNIKQRPETGDVWLLTDAGYNLLLSMNNYKWYYHLVSASRACDALDAQYKVAGPLCDSGDVYFESSDTAVCLTTVCCQAKLNPAKCSVY